MLEAFKMLLARATPPPPAQPGATPARAADPGRLQVAAAALLLEVAYADAEFSDAERLHVEEVVTRHFDLDEESARELLAVADEARRESIDLHQFTAVVTKHYDEGQRMVLAELLWRIVLADGRLSEHESSLTRKLAHLLELRPGYLAEARKRAESS